MDGLLHTVLAGANVGVFTLAAAACLVRLLIVPFLPGRHDEGSGEKRWAAGADQVAYVAAAVGLFLAVLTGLTGAFATWPMEAIRGTVLARNKIGVTATLLTAWGMFVLLRRQAGPALWEHGVLRGWSAFLVLLGFGATILVGSMGGSASLKGTLLDPALQAFGVNRFQTLAWAPAVSVLLILAALALLLYRPGRTAR
jgi:hypothetical protein